MSIMPHAEPECRNPDKAQAPAEPAVELDIAAHLGALTEMHEPHFTPHTAATNEMAVSFKGKSFQEAKHDVLARFEREYFAGLYEEAKGNISEIARRSGMERAHVRTYLKRHGIVSKPSENEG